MLSIFWIAVALASGGVVALFGLPFVLVGFYLLIGRFWLDSRQRQNTVYGVTNQRVIIESGVLSRTTKSLSLRTLTDVTLADKSDGSGIITFGPSHSLWAWYPGMAMWPGIETPPALYLTDKSREIYDLIRRAQIEELSLGEPGRRHQ